jgi:rhodanese-related sulfurtransferase
MSVAEDPAVTAAPVPTGPVAVDELDQLLRGKDEIAVLDVREALPYGIGHVLLAVSLPLSQLELRIDALVPRRTVRTVVYDGGGDWLSERAVARLGQLGYENVAVLHGGFEAWRLAGKAVSGRADVVELPGEPAGAGVHTIDSCVFRQFRREADERTLYVLDVRTPAEFAAGHLAGSVLAGGDQVVQNLGAYVGVRGARIVLVDGPDAARATVTASRLGQMGLDDVYVYPGVDDDAVLVRGPASIPVLGLPDDVASIDPHALRALLADGAAVVLDLATSPTFGHAHIPGAWFAIRSRLRHNVGTLHGTGPIVLTSPDGTLARLAAGDLEGATARPVLVVEGGTAAWVESGYPTEDGLTNLSDKPDDVDVPRLNPIIPT